jgi:hypothetical protein
MKTFCLIKIIGFLSGVNLALLKQTYVKFELKLPIEANLFNLLNKKSKLNLSFCKLLII